MAGDVELMSGLEGYLAGWLGETERSQWQRVLGAVQPPLEVVVDQQGGNRHGEPRRGGHQRLAVTQLDHRALVAQHFIAGGSLCQAVGAARVNHLVLVGIGATELRGVEGNRLDGHLGAEAQAAISDTVLVPLLHAFAALVGDLLLVT